MNAILWISSIVLVINAAHSYILLTANLEDVQSIAKQMVQSPLADQLKKIWRRASNQFNRQLGRSRVHQRVEDEKYESEEENPSKYEEDLQPSQDHETEDELSKENRVERRSGTDVAEMGKNASFYLSSVQNMIKNL